MLPMSQFSKVILIIGLFPITLFAGCDFHDHSTNPISQGDRLYVENLEYPLDADVSSLDARTINGSIKVTGTSGTPGVVRVTKKVWGDTEQEAEKFADLVRINVDRNGDAVRVYTTHPRTWPGVSVEVAYDVQCGRDADLNLITVNGKITILGAVAGVDATTVNGGIDAALSPLFSGNLDARTVNGHVDCEIPLSEVTTKTRRVLSGTVGEGRGTRVWLECVNGNIYIRTL